MGKDFEMDVVLRELGDFKKFQIVNYALICIPIILSAVFTLGYVFTAGKVSYRCNIPECDTTPQDFHPPWLQNAIPMVNNNSMHCLRYEFVGNNTSDGQCLTADNFNKSALTRCDEVIYKTQEQTIATDFNITCAENDWKLPLVGTINNVGKFVFLPVIGLISDKYGRKVVLVGGLLMCGIIGLLKSFSTSYTMFVLLEFLDSGFVSGSYGAGFILGLELVGPRKRVLGSTLISCFYAIGEALLGVLAMYTTSWRTLLRIVYTPTFLLVSYYWILPESVRWLHTKGRNEEAKLVLAKAAKVNNVQLSDSALQSLNARDEDEEMTVRGAPKDQETENEERFSSIQNKYPILAAFKSSALLLRVINCSFCWLTNTFVYYGLSLNSVTLAGNKYNNFIASSLVEIPGYLITLLVMDRYGRRMSLFWSLIFSGAACLASQFAGSEYAWATLPLYLIGKCAITVSFTVIYVYTAELFPTSLRHSLLSTCSMFGRIGSMVAPQTPLLASIWEPLPLVLFGGTAISSGFLILHFPETLNTKLPDTVDEALNLGIDDERT